MAGGRSRRGAVLWPQPVFRICDRCHIQGLFQVHREGKNYCPIPPCLPFHAERHIPFLPFTVPYSPNSLSSACHCCCGPAVARVREAPILSQPGCVRAGLSPRQCQQQQHLSEVSLPLPLSRGEPSHCAAQLQQLWSPFVPKIVGTAAISVVGKGERERRGMCL